MTEKTIHKLCAEFGIQMIDFRNRLIYKGYVIGNYYFGQNPNKTDYVIEIWGTNIRTTNYTTARKAICKKTKEIKSKMIKEKLKCVEKDFENV